MPDTRRPIEEFLDPATGLFKDNVLQEISAQDLRDFVLSTGIRVWNETPAGTVNGGNAVFTLVKTPAGGRLMLFLNGILQRAGGNDFTLVGSTITFVVAPFVGDVLLATYET